jgi:hypothetical protein
MADGPPAKAKVEEFRLSTWHRKALVHIVHKVAWHPSGAELTFPEWSG